MVTPAPQSPTTTCGDYTTTTTYRHYHCPLACVEPDNWLCPKLPCPMIVTPCAWGQTLTTPPVRAATTVTGTVTEDCTVTFKADVGCAVCGCLGCPVCVPKTIPA